MLKLSGLLARFKGLANTEKAKKECVAEVLSEIIGVPITHNQISFSKNTIFIKVQPIIKTEIAIKKEEILVKINNLSGMQYITGIQ